VTTVKVPASGDFVIPYTDVNGREIVIPVTSPVSGEYGIEVADVKGRPIFIKPKVGEPEPSSVVWKHGPYLCTGTFANNTPYGVGPYQLGSLYKYNSINNKWENLGVQIPSVAYAHYDTTHEIIYTYRQSPSVGLYSSTDDGQTWSFTGVVDYINDKGSCFLNSVENCMDTNPLRISNVSTGTLNTISPSLGLRSQMPGLVFDPSGNQVCASIGRSLAVLYVSSDNWTSYDTYLAFSVVNDDTFGRILFANDYRVFIWSGVLKKLSFSQDIAADNGTQWSSYTLSGAGSSIMSYAFDGLYGIITTAGTQLSVSGAVNDPRLFYTSDGGQTWAASATPPTGGSFHATDLDHGDILLFVGIGIF